MGDEPASSHAVEVDEDKATVTQHNIALHVLGWPSRPLFAAPPLHPAFLRRASEELSVAGMFNLGNSCFINALLQSLAGASAFADFVHRIGTRPPARHISGGRVPEPSGRVPGWAMQGEVARDLSAVFRELEPKCKSLVRTVDIRGLRLRLLGLSAEFRSGGWRQQDSDELLHLMLEVLDQARDVVMKEAEAAQVLESIGVKVPERSQDVELLMLEPNPMQGTVMSQTMCKICGTVSPLRGSAFHVLPLSLISLSTGRVISSLESALEGFVAQEVVKDVECFGLCKERKRTMYKRSSIGKMPKVLCIHLGRNHYDFRSGRMAKLMHHVKFPVRLDISKFGFHECQMETNLLAQIEALKGSCAEDPFGFLLQKPHQYSLQSVIVHRGSAYGGHFTCFRGIENGHWVHISDEKVEKVSIEQVLQAEAYMLFYIR